MTIIGKAVTKNGKKEKRKERKKSIKGDSEKAIKKKQRQ